MIFAILRISCATINGGNAQARAIRWTTILGKKRRVVERGWEEGMGRGGVVFSSEGWGVFCIIFFA